MVWDERLGAEKLDLLLLDHFADEFQAKHGTDIRQFPKAVAKLKRQVQFLSPSLGPLQTVSRSSSNVRTPALLCYKTVLVMIPYLVPAFSWLYWK